MDKVICKEVIITIQTRRGDGKEIPIRIVTEVFEKNGTKIAEDDCDTITREQLRTAFMTGFPTADSFDEWYNNNFH